MHIPFGIFALLVAVTFVLGYFVGSNNPWSKEKQILKDKIKNSL